MGLTGDPSHLVWQMTTSSRPSLIRSSLLSLPRQGPDGRPKGAHENGILSLGRWQVHRSQTGDSNWKRLFMALYRSGYDYVICVEHEDGKGGDRRPHSGLL